jgi:hypothetical protein
MVFDRPDKPPPARAGRGGGVAWTTVPPGRRGGRSTEANVGRAGGASTNGGLRGGARSVVEDGARVGS